MYRIGLIALMLLGAACERKSLGEGPVVAGLVSPGRRLNQNLFALGMSLGQPDSSVRVSVSNGREATPRRAS